MAQLVALGREIDQAVKAAAAGLRARGYSWTEIADRLAISRQAAQQRWGHAA